MYQVIVYYHDKYWRGGDLEDKFELIAQENFKTRKAAKSYIEADMARHSGTKKEYWHKGDKPSYCYVYTGVTWQHENTGEMMEECYQYILDKVKLR